MAIFEIYWQFSDLEEGDEIDRTDEVTVKFTVSTGPAWDTANMTYASQAKLKVFLDDRQSTENDPDRRDTPISEDPSNRIALQNLATDDANDPEFHAETWERRDASYNAGDFAVAREVSYELGDISEGDIIERYLVLKTGRSISGKMPAYRGTYLFPTIIEYIPVVEPPDDPQYELVTPLIFEVTGG